MNEIKELQINGATVRLKNMSDGRGEIVIHDYCGHNYSYLWGAMGSMDIETFIMDISPKYFADKLLGARGRFVFDNQKTFAQLRKFISDEIGLPWYKHTDFQKDLRANLKSYQARCDSENQFVDLWNSFIDNLDYSLIEERFERKRIQEDFKNISEVWHITQQKESAEHTWLVDLHRNLVKQLKSLRTETVIYA